MVSYHSFTRVFFFLKGKGHQSKQRQTRWLCSRSKCTQSPRKGPSTVPGCDTARDATAGLVLVIPFSLNLKYSTSCQSFYFHFLWLQ